MRAEHDPAHCLWCEFKGGLLRGVEEVWMVFGALGLFVTNSLAAGWRAIAGTARDYLEQQERERLWRENAEMREEVARLWSAMRTEVTPGRPSSSPLLFYSGLGYSIRQYSDPDTTPLGDLEPDDWRATAPGEPTRRI